MTRRIRIKGKSYADKRDCAGRMYGKLHDEWMKLYGAQARKWDNLKKAEKLLDKYTKLADNEHKFNEDIEHNRIAVVNKETGWSK